MIFGSTALEVAIGMIFVYLLLSLLCSAINEYIESIINFRGKALRRGIELLLNDTVKTKGSQDLAAKLYAHGLIRPLYRDLDKLPSYIPARTFALALWNMAITSEPDDNALESPPASLPNPLDKLTDLQKLKQVINTLPNEELKQALVSLIDDAKGDFDKARKNIEDWYDGAMDRVSGWYKRRTQAILILIGIIAAAAINADSISIGKALIRDPTLRDSVAKATENYYASATPMPTPTTQTTPTPIPKPTATPTLNPRVASHAPTTPAATASPTPSPVASPSEDAGKLNEEKFKKAQEQIQHTRALLDDLGLPLGWVKRDCTAFEKDAEQKDTNVCKEDALKNKDDLRHVPNGGGEWLLKFFGLFLTGLAISQGAPFWFDVLNKFMVIRSTVKPKEKSPDEASKDKTKPKPDNRGVEDNADTNENGEERLRKRE
jgi:hypothetical protein